MTLSTSVPVCAVGSRCLPLSRLDPHPLPLAVVEIQ